MDSPLERHEALLQSLRDTLTATVARALGNPSKVDAVLLDRPDHSNVGDHAIWLGSRRLLRTLGVRCRYSPSIRTTDWERVDAATRRGGVIILHGGGNFGDLWPRHQEYREEVLRRFPDRRIVQFPQSIHFDDKMAIDRSRRVLLSHKSLTILVRDVRSAAFLEREMGIESTLCPDAALALELKRPPTRHDGPVILLRTDHESTNPRPDRLHQYAVVDWLNAGAPPRTSIDGLGLRAGRRLSKGSTAVGDLAGNLEDRASVYHLRRGTEMLAAGRYVVTDRLHAHILAFLMRIPNTALDNTSGKVHGFIDKWTGESPLVRKAVRLEDAIAHVGEGPSTPR